jgi:hypothetical protein
VFLVARNYNSFCFEEELKLAIQVTWRAYGVPQSFIDNYFSANAGIVCTKLSDRSSVGKLTAVIRDFHHSSSDINYTAPFQHHFVDFYRHAMFKPTAGYELHKTPKGYYEYYSDWATAKNLESGNYAVPEFPFYEIELEYVESTCKIVRRIEVPTSISFEKLHRCIQKVFLWSDYHLWDFLVVSTQGLDKPRERRLRSDNPIFPSIELEPTNAQPEVDFAFDTTMGLKPLARIKPDSDDEFDWMYDGVENFYPSTVVSDFLETEDRAIYTYDYGANHTIRVLVTKRFNKENNQIVCTEVQGDARGEDDNPPLLTLDGKLNFDEDTPYTIPLDLLFMTRIDKGLKKTIKALGGPQAFLLSVINESLRCDFSIR